VGVLEVTMATERDTPLHRHYIDSDLASCISRVKSLVNPCEKWMIRFDRVLRRVRERVRIGIIGVRGTPPRTTDPRSTMYAPDHLPTLTARSSFTDSFDAGERLAEALRRTLDAAGVHADDVLVAGVTEGGLPLAYVVSMDLDVDLEPAPIESLHAPHARSIRIGVLVDDGTAYVDEALGDRHGARGTTLDHLIDRAQVRLESQMVALGDEPGAAIRGSIVVLVDDVVDSGATAVAVTDWLRRWGAQTVIVAVAAGTRRGMERARESADVAFCLVEVEDGESPHDCFADRPGRAAIDDEQLMRAIRAGNDDRRRRRQR
jgi:predicted phosphoribosyltransferase